MNSTLRYSVLIPVVGLSALLAGCEPPPVDSAQIGYRGVAMQTVERPAKVEELRGLNVVPAAIPAAPSDGPLAGAVYKNVQVLDDLSVAEFTRLMLAITQWVAPPDQSCAYCHGGDDLSSDALYTKVVSRRMLEMVRDINSNWKNHVAGTGVTCWTCHRGKAVPENIWFKDPGPAHAAPYAGNLAGQNAPSDKVAVASLPNDPFSQFLMDSSPIRAISTSALPGQPGTSTQHTEATYGLMMHASQALGVNCTFCHNSRSFVDWQESTPQRVTAWHGIRLVRDLNVKYLEPLTPAFPANRLGPTGDAPKVNCATCHQGVNKPLYGISMLPDYPELAARRPAAAPAAGAATAPAP
jgi:photosynthetic reaction center cytochrome c subunit